MSKSTLIAAAVAVALVAWIASGWLLGGAEPRPAPVGPGAERQPFPVEVRRSRAEPVTRALLNQGEVLPDRTVTLRAEVAGRLAEIATPEGTRVEAGEVVARIDAGDLDARRDEAQALVDQAQADYDAALELQDRGVTTQARLRERFTALQSARAALERIAREIENLTIEAPFAGIVNEVALDEGEFVTVNAPVATLIDNDPLVVAIDVPQQSIGDVAVGRPAQVRFVTGETAEGDVSYVSAAAERETRTFRVEIRVPNPDGSVPSGISAETRIPIEQVPAHFFSPALLSLSSEGQLGVKTVTEEGVVAFHAVDIVQARAQGVYVSGLPEEIALITVGQGFVAEGERVRAVEAQSVDVVEQPGASLPRDALPLGDVPAPQAPPLAPPPAPAAEDAR
ncbi:efflux RND transporter periplasmic adaptor subunit [Salinarimonas rosea]|uniref:efflux RND transporter periplasmic adaptor subunit n=1 Tax=Salinarimonas rosea TaxID=552063 RepID=UPI0003F9C880|nr:efflux RND transporter periplasmic adaptor subunit [Salinarimonas rosea]